MKCTARVSKSQMVNATTPSHVRLNTVVVVVLGELTKGCVMLLAERKVGGVAMAPGNRIAREPRKRLLHFRSCLFDRLGKVLDSHVRDNQVVDNQLPVAGLNLL